MQLHGYRDQAKNWLAHASRSQKAEVLRVVQAISDGDGACRRVMFSEQAMNGKPGWWIARLPECGVDLVWAQLTDYPNRFTVVYIGYLAPEQ